MFEKFPTVRTAEPLSKHCTFNIGGPADFFVEVDDIEEIPKLIDEAKVNNLPYFILGGGSNVLFHDDGYRGLIIKVVANILEFEEDGKVTADVGVNVTKLVQELMKRGLTGLEPLLGLPGTLGGAIFGNAGAHGTEIGDFVESATILTNDGELKEVDHDYFEFSYRHSNLHETKETVLKVELRLKIAETKPEEGKEAIKFRLETQPTGFNNGSFFKNPAGDYAGRLIDVAGLKGTKIGGAQISSKHGNFFMNDGTATAADIIALRNLAKSSVKEQFGVELEEEVRIMMPDGRCLNDD